MKTRKGQKVRKGVWGSSGKEDAWRNIGKRRVKNEKKVAKVYVKGRQTSASLCNDQGTTKRKAILGESEISVKELRGDHAA